MTRGNFLRVLALTPVVLLAACGGNEGESEDDARDPRVLVRAAAVGDTAEVRRLLARGADVDGRTAAGRTAATAAALGDHV